MSELSGFWRVSHRSVCSERVVRMQNSWSPVRAAIDIGSNTIHIVVARATAHMLDIAADEVELVRIGESVNAGGRISLEKIDHALSVLSSIKRWRNSIAPKVS